MDVPSSERPSEVEQVSRPEALDRIRRQLRALISDEECACVVAARYGILCGGLGGLSDREFRRRFDWIVRPRPRATREELEATVCAYHVGRQQVTGAPLCCDLETREHCACDGWNMFDNPTLERFYRELTGKSVAIG